MKRKNEFFSLSESKVSWLFILVLIKTFELWGRIFPAKK